jgi:DhnA family fructose-bisphosphate aldolase class Ia
MALGLKVYAEPEQEREQLYFIANVVQVCRRDGLVSTYFIQELSYDSTCYAGSPG